MSNDWIDNELETVDLNDKRLNERLVEILAALGKRPNVSIPAACGGHAETMAAYRFFENPKTTFEKILKPHQDATEKRIAGQEVILCVQDTTELDLTRPRQQIRGAGLIGTETNRRGACLHLLEAFTPDGTPLGAVWAKTILRAEEETRTSEEIKARQKRLALIPLEEKETFRWLEGYRETIKLAERNENTTCVCVGDSECDMFEVFAEKRSKNAHLLVRMCQDRSVVEGELVFNHIRSTVYAMPVIGTKTVFIRARPTKSVPIAKKPREQVRKSRDAELEIRKATVTIKPPQQLRSKFKSVTMNVVVVSEINPPKGEQPIEWILLTTLPIGTWQQVLTVIKDYECRWMIEVFFKTLKSGCKAESLRFEEMSRLLPCLGVYLIVSWRVLMICRLGRSAPEMSCETVFEEAEWKATFRVAHPKKKFPKKAPTMDFMMRFIGELGGWISTPGKSEMPGPQTTWIGLQRVQDFARAWKLFGPDTQKYQKDAENDKTNRTGRIGAAAPA